MSTDYRNFLSLSYEELEELNLEAKKERVSHAPNRCRRDLGTIGKGCEVQFHHAVYNQSLWNLF